MASRVAAAVKAKFTTVQTPAASTLEGQGGGIAKIPPGATLHRSCSLHADTFMGAPGSQLGDGGRADPLDANAGGLATRRRVRSSDDFPLAAFIGQAVADLKIHR